MKRVTRTTRPRRVWRSAGVLGAAALATVALTGAATGSTARDHGGHGGHGGHGSQRGETFAVIGDIPYGDAQIKNFPNVIKQINADPAVRWVTHLGDIKSGSSLCTDDYNAMIKQRFDSFADPLIYTPGDNEWTDCHRANNGSYNPLERLSALRKVFFSHPGETLGQHPIKVASQNSRGLPENVLTERSGVTFAFPNLPGSNNSLAPWTGKTQPTPEQASEVLDRTAADIDLIETAFANARAHHNRGVALMTQADMFDPTVTNPAFADYYGYQAIVRTIVRESAAFRGQVYLFNGDSHVYNADYPLAAGSKWPAFYGVSPLTNFTRTTVDGSTAVDDYLRVTIHPTSKDVLTWERAPFTN